MTPDFENPQPVRPQPTNYFISAQRRFNTDNFIPFVKPEQIQRSAKDRIFKEMVRGQIDYSQFGKYFLDSKFAENLLVAAQDELNNNAVVLEALRYQDLNFPGNPLVTKLIGQYSSLSHIYQVLYGKLSILRISGDIGILVDTAYILKPYKNVL